MLQSQQIKELRKSGKLEESLHLALQDLDANPNNLFAKRNVGWVYNDMLKQAIDENKVSDFIKILEHIADLQMPDTENMLFDNVAWKIGSVLFKMLKWKSISYEDIFRITDLAKTFHYTKPSEAYSFLMKAAHKVLKQNKFKHNEFVDWWNPQNLREEDFRKDVLGDGTQIMSLAEQIYTSYFKSKIPSADNPVERKEIEENVKKIDEIVEKNQSFIYLIYFKVQMLLAIGEKENILKDFLPFAQKKSREFWVWDLLGQIVDSEEDKLTCLCMACLSGNKVEQMKTNIYLKMSNYFVSKNMLPQAKNELQKIVTIKKSNNQKIPYKVESLINTAWFQDTIASDSNISFYKQHSENSDSIIFSDVQSEDIFVYNINEEKKMVNFIRLNDEIGFFKHDRINPNLKIKIGDVLTVRFFQLSKEHPSKLLTLKKGFNNILMEKNLRKETGKIKISEKGFGFFNDAFISANKVQKYRLLNNSEASAEIIRTYNRKKEALGWELLSIIES